MSVDVKEITDANFDGEVLKSVLPVLVDFWAPWCAPCRSIAPLLEEIAKEYQGKLVVCKINVDENSKTPSSYDVRGIPNLVFFKGGKMVDRVVGAIPKEHLVASIKKVI